MQMVFQMAHRRRGQLIQQRLEVTDSQCLLLASQLSSLFLQNLIVIVALQAVEGRHALFPIIERSGAQNPEVEQQLDTVPDSNALTSKLLKVSHQVRRFFGDSLYRSRDGPTTPFSCCHSTR
ncbi:hypothetical protein ALO72_200017 [Pseudomonas syringae pv. delphinii]|nr:hypothetical protein ALO72_200017 [Pseudomonas syringae pv. delphinii]